VGYVLILGVIVERRDGGRVGIWVVVKGRVVVECTRVCVDRAESVYRMEKTGKAERYLRSPVRCSPG
jgi:hypothetical protein